MNARNRIFAAAVLSFALPLTVSAQVTGGNRPVRIIVPVPPGGPSDTAVRLILPRLAEGLKQTFVADNRPGSNGVAGTDIASKASPDGHTISVGNSGTHAINASLYSRLPYDPIRDFVPIVQLVTSGMVVAANPRVPGKTLTEFLGTARRQPGQFNIGVAGATGEISGDALWSRAQVKMNNVRYKGSAPTELALLGGEVDVALLTPLATRQHILSGKMKAYGITSSQRSPVLPDVPTVAEQGVTGYDFQIWHGLFAPRGTPEKVVRDVNRAAVAALNTPGIKERFNSLGFVTIGNTPEEFARIVKSELEKFRKVIVESGIKVE
ncbi:MAG: tripartite tricarboxylate transporter substrate binding protein [Burkholderiales bacterium]|nr:tripartite tricarboxylate transporter substrate binding protein [Burkholderiales bacterium]